MNERTMSEHHSSEMMSPSIDDIPKEISVLEFVECRARELDAMMQSVSAPVGGGNRTPMQLLPRHMRRRAANHDVRRLPLSRRLAAKKELDARPAAKRRPPTRRHRRRPSNLLDEYARRKRKHVWLETHIWHAKRFHMTDRWGYRLPQHPNDRGTRSIYRDSVRRCVLLDISYYCCIELCGDQQYLVESLARLSSPEIGPSFGAKCYLNGGREGHTIIYHADCYPWSAIGEVSFMWRSSGDVGASIGKQNLWIWTHPSCHDAVFAEFKKVFCLSEDDCRQTPVVGKELDVTEPEITADCLPPLKKKLKLGSFDDAAQIAKGQKLQELASHLVVVQRDNAQLDPRANGDSSSHPEESAEMDTALDVSLTCSTTNVNFHLNHVEPGADSNALFTSTESTKKNNKSIKAKKKKQKMKQPPMISKVGLTRYVYDNGTVTLESLKDDLCRFRLIGPTAHRVIAEALSFIDAKNVAKRSSSDETTETSTMNLQWWKDYYSDKKHYLQLVDQMNCWKACLEQQNAAEFPLHVVISLLVKDPRLFLPAKRSPVSNNSMTSDSYARIRSLDLSTSISPIWERSIRDAVKLSKLTTTDLNNLRSQYLVPGTMPDFGDSESVIPILLVQRPSVNGHLSLLKQSTRSDCGYGSGWDVILPTNWAMPFWVAFIYRGAKAAGLRDLHSLSMESGTLISPDSCPDTSAASETSQSQAAELRAVYERRPPAKRCNFTKLGVSTPFHCPWPQLVRGWLGSSDLPVQGDSFYCLRNRKWLRKLVETSALNSRCKTLADRSNKSTESFSVDLLSDLNLCIVPVTIRMLGRGVPGKFSLICLPKACDIRNHCGGGGGGGKRSNSRVSEPVEPIHNKSKTNSSGAVLTSVVDVASRRTLGFVVEGGFSHNLGCGFGVGFVSLPGLLKLFSENLSERRKSSTVLVRPTTSLHYHAAELSLVV